ncbi:MAG: glycosyltransferase [Planctomycetota bacterium]|nr:glycosyltransferase [Planctomycetota bacterium]
MRIGIDLLAIQATSCRGRGIGRYAKSLLRTLLLENPSWDFIFYRRPDLEMDWDENLNDRVSEWVDVEPDPRSEPDGTLQRVVQNNRQRLDWFLVPNPVVQRRGFALPEPVPGGPKLAAIVYDLIPSLFPKHYLDDPKLAMEYHRDLRRLRSYDLLLAISEATGKDLRTLLGVPDRRIVNIQAATDPEYFRPAEDAASGDIDIQILLDLGITGPFLYYLGNVDWRKNVLGLVDAYALLPESVRDAYPLVLTFGTNAWFSAVLREKIDELGLGGRVIATGPANDEAVRALYRRASIFLSPSHYEGFGLPILEAMSCGAAVVVADNSSQPEVAGPAGVLARTDHPADWACKITDLIRDPDRLAALRGAAILQARQFSWNKSAEAVRDAIEAFPKRMADTGDRMAIVAYPSRSGLSYDPGTAAIVAELMGSKPTILFIDERRAPSLFPLPDRSGWYERRLLGRILPLVGNPEILYLVDSLDSLSPLIGDLTAHAGVVVFGNIHITDLTEHSTHGNAENDLREVLRLAIGVTCYSPWLYEQMRRMASDDPGLRIPTFATPITASHESLRQAS